jgi:hypothetical protein
MDYDYEQFDPHALRSFIADVVFSMERNFKGTKSKSQFYEDLVYGLYEMFGHQIEINSFAEDPRNANCKLFQEAIKNTMEYIKRKNESISHLPDVYLSDGVYVSAECAREMNMDYDPQCLL